MRSIPDSELATAFSQGAKDFERGWTAKDNPHNGDPAKHSAWLRGWREAQTKWVSNEHTQR